MDRLLLRDNPFEPDRFGGRIYLLSPHMIGIDYQRELMTVSDPKWYRRTHADGSISETTEEDAIMNKPEESCIILSIEDYDIDLKQLQGMSTLAILGCPSTKTE